MNCCVNCFTSPYLISIINGDDRIGTCDFCDTQETSIYSARELSPFFRNILSLYVVDDHSQITIADSLQKDFNIISKNVDNPISLLQIIVSDEADFDLSIFQNNVIQKSRSLLTTQADEVHNVWNDFKEEIKFTNRYHIKNTIDLDKLKKFFTHESFYRDVKKGRIFYRCRVSDKDGFPSEKMGNPPVELASSGRANPKGISYLYVADSLETSLYETRADTI